MDCEGYSKKKMFWGILILLFGLVWYLRDTNAIALEPFWPIVAMVFGLVIILKGLMFKPEKKR